MYLACKVVQQWLVDDAQGITQKWKRKGKYSPFALSIKYSPVSQDWILPLVPSLCEVQNSFCVNYQGTPHNLAF